MLRKFELLSIRIFHIGIQASVNYVSLINASKELSLIHSRLWDVNINNNNPFSAGTAFIRQNLMSVDARFKNIEAVPALQEFKYF